MSIQDYNEIFQNPTTKQMRLEFSNEVVLTNTDICSEEMSLEESLCTDDKKLDYGQCNASCFEVRVVNSGSFEGETVVVTMTINAGTEDEETLDYGTYKVYSDKLTNDRMWRDLICYDALYDILNADMTEWYESLTFPMTIKNLRDSFFDYLEVDQVETTLINDSFVTAGGFDVNGTLTGKIIIESICQINGVFGHINRQGKFEYISVPSSEKITYAWYIDGTGQYEDYETDVITGITVKDVNEDIGTSVGTKTNEWIILANPLIYGTEGSPALLSALNNLYNKVKNVKYRPLSVDTYGNPMLPIGTSIKLNVRRYDPETGYDTQELETIVIKRRLTGIQALTDSFESIGEKAYSNELNSVQSQLIQTRGKIHVFDVTLDEFKSTITEMEDDMDVMESNIEQNTQNIELEVRRAKSAEETRCTIIGYYVETVGGEDVLVFNTDLVLDEDIRDGQLIAAWENASVREDYKELPKYINYSVDGTVKYFPIFYNGSDIMTDQYTQGSVFHLMYKENQSIIADATESILVTDDDSPIVTDTGIGLVAVEGTETQATGFWIGTDTSWAKIDLTADAIRLEVQSDIAEVNSTIEQTATEIRSEVNGYIYGDEHNGVVDYSYGLQTNPGAIAIRTGYPDEFAGLAYTSFNDDNDDPEGFAVDANDDNYIGKSWLKLGTQFTNSKYNYDFYTSTYNSDTDEYEWVRTHYGDAAFATTLKVYRIDPSSMDTSDLAGENLDDHEGYTIAIEFEEINSDPLRFLELWVVHYGHYIRPIVKKTDSGYTTNFTLETETVYRMRYVSADTLNLSDTFISNSLYGFKYVWLLIDDISLLKVQSSVEQLANSYAVRVTSDGSLVYEELGIDPSTSTSYFEVNADNLKFVANKSLDMTASKLSIDSTYFSVTASGEMTCTSGHIGGWDIDANGLTKTFTISGSTYTSTITPTEFVVETSNGGISFDNYGFSITQRGKTIPLLETEFATPGLIVGENLVFGLAYGDVKTLSGTLWGQRDPYDSVGYTDSLQQYIYGELSKQHHAGVTYSETINGCHGYVVGANLYLWVPIEFVANVQSVYITSVTLGLVYTYGNGNGGNAMMTYASADYSNKLAVATVLRNQNLLFLSFVNSPSWLGYDYAVCMGSCSIAFIPRDY